MGMTYSPATTERSMIQSHVDESASGTLSVLRTTKRIFGMDAVFASKFELEIDSIDQPMRASNRSRKERCPPPP
jgi:hypothetical protein